MKITSCTEKPDNVLNFFLLRFPFQSHPFISELILRALLSSDKRQEDGGMLEEWVLSLPHAFALGFLSFTRCLPRLPASASTPPSPLWPWLAFSPSASLCVFIKPSLHQWPFHWGSRVGFEWGMQRSCLHISRDGVLTPHCVKYYTKLYNWDKNFYIIPIVHCCHINIYKHGSPRGLFHDARLVGQHLDLTLN